MHEPPREFDILKIHEIAFIEHTDRRPANILCDRIIDYGSVNLQPSHNLPEPTDQDIEGWYRAGRR